MAGARAFETIVGAGVLLAAAGFLGYAWQASGRAAATGSYDLVAAFGRVDGVKVGSEVRIAGVKVGAVAASGLDPSTYEARLLLSIAPGVDVPEDSIAKISSEGVLGGAFVSIEPGASDVMLKPGERIAITQGSVDLLAVAVDAFTTNAAKQGDAAPNGDVP